MYESLCNKAMSLVYLFYVDDLKITIIYCLYFLTDKGFKDYMTILDFICYGSKCKVTLWSVPSQQAYPGVFFLIVGWKF